MEADVLLNAYIDLNLLLLAGTALWLGMRWGLRKVNMGSAFVPQLKLLNLMVLVLAASPVVAHGLKAWVLTNPPNLTDVLVSQYLQGNVNMAASDLQSLLGTRESLVRALTLHDGVISQVVIGLFLLGAGFCALQTLTTGIHLRQMLKRAYPLKRIGGVQVLVSDAARVAFSTRGLKQRYVVLPTAALNDPDDLRLTLAHEIQHFRHRDVEFEFLMEAVRPLLWWNPAFYVWRQEMRRVREFACDEAVAARPGFDARAYCECLIRACRSATQERVFFGQKALSVGLIDGAPTGLNHGLHGRILAITSQKTAPGWRSFWMAMACVFLTATLATSILTQRSGDWSHDRLMLSTIVNLDRMAERSDAGTSFGERPY